MRFPLNKSVNLNSQEVLASRIVAIWFLKIVFKVNKAMLSPAKYFKGRYEWYIQIVFSDL